MANTRNCHHCETPFTIADWDEQFCARMDVPPPTLCARCRQRRRTLQVNQVHLFRRTCDATGDSIISNYPPDGPFQVYSQPFWYSDAFDGTSYGRDFDFNRPFFEQFHELSLVVPRPSLFTDYLRDENCAYTNYAGKNKNCYLIFDSDENWDCYYSYGIFHSKNCSDCYRVQYLELCYETVDSTNCYNCSFTYNSENCSDSAFINNCIGCKNCVLCSNLQQKESYLRNKPATRAEIEQFLHGLHSASALTAARVEFEDFRLRFPQKATRGFHNENVTGNHLVHCKNARSCFDSINLWDAANCTQIFIGAKDCLDCHECGESELVYESCNLGYNAYHVRFSFHCLNQLTNLTYCNYCFNGCRDLFGCIGLKRKSYCLLNKQYSADDYARMVNRVIGHMRETGEWGEFFPPFTSSFPYNLTVAQEHFPLTEEQAVASGYQWRPSPKEEYQVATAVVPSILSDVPESITREVLACEVCSKNYKIILQEVQFHRFKSLALPRVCFHCRHLARVKRRTPQRLWVRACARCNEALETAYPPEGGELIYCERCYLESLA